SHWQRRRLAGEMERELLSYWKKELLGSPPLVWPTEDSRPRSKAGQEIRFRIPPDVRDAVAAQGRRFGASPFISFLPAFKIVLFRFTGNGDVSVGVPTAGRARRELEGIIGNFTNMVVLRTRMSDELSLGEVLKAVQKTARRGYARQELPFDVLLHAL